MITFNEITPLFIHFLDQDNFISKNYNRSLIDFSPKTGYDVEGNLVLIKKTLNKYNSIKFN